MAKPLGPLLSSGNSFVSFSNGSNGSLSIPYEKSNSRFSKPLSLSFFGEQDVEEEIGAEAESNVANGKVTVATDPANEINCPPDDDFGEFESVPAESSQAVDSFSTVEWDLSPSNFMLMAHGSGLNASLQHSVQPLDNFFTLQISDFQAINKYPPNGAGQSHQIVNGAYPSKSEEELAVVDNDDSDDWGDFVLPSPQAHSKIANGVNGGLVPDIVDKSLLDQISNVDLDKNKNGVHKSPVLAQGYATKDFAAVESLDIFSCYEDPLSRGTKGAVAFENNSIGSLLDVYDSLSTNGLSSDGGGFYNGENGTIEAFVSKNKTQIVDILANDFMLDISQALSLQSKGSESHCQSYDGNNILESRNTWFSSDWNGGKTLEQDDATSGKVKNLLDLDFSTNVSQSYTSVNPSGATNNVSFDIFDYSLGFNQGDSTTHLETEFPDQGLKDHTHTLSQEIGLDDLACSIREDLKVGENVKEDMLMHGRPSSTILSGTSVTDQHLYIKAWSALASACSFELDHGLNIWQQATRLDISSQVLHTIEGRSYFAALGQVYLVHLLLRAATQIYEPWLQSTTDQAKELSTSMNCCHASWSKLQAAVNMAHSGLRNGMPIDSASWAELENKILAIQSAAATFDGREAKCPPVCHLTLLPTDTTISVAPVVEWNDKQYFLPVANLWVNRVSGEPPKFR